MKKWFDLKAFKNCTAEQGIPIFLCNKKIISPANPEYGVKEIIGFEETPLSGHIERQRTSIMTDSGSVITETIFAYILAINFSPKELTSNSYIRAGDLYYQIELIDTIYSRGIELQYKFKMEKTDKNKIKIVNNSILN